MTTGAHTNGMYGKNPPMDVNQPKGARIRTIANPAANAAREKRKTRLMKRREPFTLTPSTASHRACQASRCNGTANRLPPINTHEGKSTNEYSTNWNAHAPRRRKALPRASSPAATEKRSAQNMRGGSDSSDAATAVRQGRGPGLIYRTYPSELVKFHTVREVGLVHPEHARELRHRHLALLSRFHVPERDVPVRELLLADEDRPSRLHRVRVVQVLRGTAADEIDVDPEPRRPQVGGDFERLLADLVPDRDDVRVEAWRRNRHALHLGREHDAVHADREPRREDWIAAEQLRERIGPAAPDLVLRAEVRRGDLKHHSCIV